MEVAYSDITRAAISTSGASFVKNGVIGNFAVFWACSALPFARQLAVNRRVTHRESAELGILAALRANRKLGSTRSKPPLGIYEMSSSHLSH
jgi:hypothetical protein